MVAVLCNMVVMLSSRVGSAACYTYLSAPPVCFKLLSGQRACALILFPGEGLTSLAGQAWWRLGFICLCAMASALHRALTWWNPGGKVCTVVLHAQHCAVVISGTVTQDIINTDVLAGLLDM